MWRLRFSWRWILCFGRYLLTFWRTSGCLSTKLHGMVLHLRSPVWNNILPCYPYKLHRNLVQRRQWVENFCAFICDHVLVHIYVYVAVDMLMRNVMWLITVVSSWFLLIFTQWLLPEWAAGSSHVCITIFTRMQDNSNGRWAPKSKTSAKKHYYSVNFIHSVHKVCHIISTLTSWCHCLHLHRQCLHLPHTHS